jgi:hypothetical protein
MRYLRAPRCRLFLRPLRDPGSRRTVARLGRTAGVGEGDAEAAGAAIGAVYAMEARAIVRAPVRPKKVLEGLQRVRTAAAEHSHWPVRFS